MIKIENIFDRFHRNIYTIKYQKHNFFYMHFLIFLYSTNYFFEAFQIDKVIYAKLFIIEINSIKEFTKIIVLVIFHSFYRDINFYSLYISNIQV